MKFKNEKVVVAEKDTICASHKQITAHDIHTHCDTKKFVIIHVTGDNCTLLAMTDDQQRGGAHPNAANQFKVDHGFLPRVTVPTTENLIQNPFPNQNVFHNGRVSYSSEQSDHGSSNFSSIRLVEPTLGNLESMGEKYAIFGEHLVDSLVDSSGFGKGPPHAGYRIPFEFKRVHLKRLGLIPDGK